MPALASSLNVPREVLESRLTASVGTAYVRRMDMRLLERHEVKLLWTIDRSEVHHHTYVVRDRQLVRARNYFEVPGWRADAPEKETPALLDCFDRGGTFLGVFDAEELIGMGVVDS